MTDILILGANGACFRDVQRAIPLTSASLAPFGIAGYSGRLTARYLLEHPQRHAFTLALAGRSRAKVEAAGLSLDQSVRIWEVDVTKPETIEVAVSQVSVVINCVGPFWRHGSNVVSCVACFCRRHVAYCLFTVPKGVREARQALCRHHRRGAFHLGNHQPVSI
jgi:hypothetical protein